MTALGNGTAPPFARVDVLGVGISAIDPADALGEVTRWIDNGLQHYVCVTGVHGVMESQGDPEWKTLADWVNRGK